MKKLIVVGLFLNAALFTAIWQELSAGVVIGGGVGGSPCETDPTKYTLDTNGDEEIDISDFAFGLNWFFRGAEPPRVCLATAGVRAGVPPCDVYSLDTNGDGGIDLSDFAYGLSWFFTGTEAPRVCLAEALPGFTFAQANPATGLHEYTHDQTGILFVLLPGGTFQMGSPDTEPNGTSMERPVHDVTLDPFLIGKTEVTQAQYYAVMGSNPSVHKGNDQRPVDTVSFDDLNAAGGFLQKTGLRLPTEAQWEYACRAGTSTAFFFGDDCNMIHPCDRCALADRFMWWCGNADSVRTKAVGQKEANPFGLFDMHGNVLELCRDEFGAYSLPVNPGDGERQPTGFGFRVARGGSWFTFASYCRSAVRIESFSFAREGDSGFRVAAPLP